MRQKGFSPIIILIIIVLAISGAFLYLKFNKIKSVEENPTPISQSPSPTSSTKNFPTWKNYQDNNFKFEIEYPSTWTAVSDTLNKGKGNGYLDPDILVYFTQEEVGPMGFVQYGEVDIHKVENTTQKDVEKWFDVKNAPNPALPVTGSERVKVNVFTSVGGIKVVESGSFTTQEFYFILGNEVLIFEGNLSGAEGTTESPKNLEFKNIYRHMVDSLKKI